MGDDFNKLEAEADELSVQFSVDEWRSIYKCEKPVSRPALRKVLKVIGNRGGTEPVGDFMERFFLELRNQRPELFGASRNSSGGCCVVLFLAATILAASSQDWRIVGGKVVDAEKDRSFQSVDLYYWGYKSNALIGYKAILKGEPVLLPGRGYEIKRETKHGPLVKIRNAPIKPYEADEMIQLRAKPLGTEVDDPEVYEVYDFTKRAPKEMVEAEEARQKSEARDAAILRQKAEQDRTAAQRAAQAPRILAYQLQQASNGLPSFQLILGKRYLTGDGVETNLALARHWLQSAVTNGETAAQGLLTQIK